LHILLVIFDLNEGHVVLVELGNAGFEVVRVGSCWNGVEACLFTCLSNYFPLSPCKTPGKLHVDKAVKIHHYHFKYLNYIFLYLLLCRVTLYSNLSLNKLIKNLSCINKIKTIIKYINK